MVAGSSGRVGSWVGGSTANVNPTPHPVMYASLRYLGSVVLDVNGDRLDAKFLRSNGAIEDSFTLLKDIPNVPPTVTISIPQAGAQLYGHTDVALNADATDTGGTVGQVDFYANATLIGSDTTAPFSVMWSDIKFGQYALTAAATDNLGATTVSTRVNVSVVGQPFTSWQAAHFTEAEIAAGLADATADADFDGLLNVAEYALGADPRESTPPLISALDATGHLTLTFTRPKGLPSLSYRGEVSGDLASWLSLDTPELLIDSDPQTLRFRDPVGADASAQRFIRLRIDSTTP